MNKKTKADVEFKKSLFQTKVKNLLCSYGSYLSDEQDNFISNAMEYIVKNHNSYSEQYERISEFIFAIDGITYQHKCYANIMTTALPVTTAFCDGSPF